LEYFNETRVLPCYFSIDKETETGNMSTIRAYLAVKLIPMGDSRDAVIFRPCTSNEIER